MDATTKTLHNRNIPITSGKEAVARSLLKSFQSLARPHPLHLHLRSLHFHALQTAL